MPARLPQAAAWTSRGRARPMRWSPYTAPPSTTAEISPSQNSPQVTGAPDFWMNAAYQP